MTKVSREFISVSSLLVVFTMALLVFVCGKPQRKGNFKDLAVDTALKTVPKRENVTGAGLPPQKQSIPGRWMGCYSSINRQRWKTNQLYQAI